MIIVERVNANEMEKQVWRFHLMTGNSDIIEVRLSDYELQRRESKRHKFKTHWQEKYDRFRSRESGMKAQEVPMPADVIEQARQHVVERILVTRDKL